MPYGALQLPTEVAGPAVEVETACSVWLSGLPDSCTVAPLEALVEERVRGSSAAGALLATRLSDQPGAAQLRLSSARAALAACEALDGAAGPPDEAGLQRPLLALPEPVARRWRAAHARLLGGLKRLTGTRSFHNFSPGFATSQDPRSVRSVYRCRSNITCGYRDLCAGRAFAVLRIIGRDFLYRQIRGMAGLVVAVASGAVPEAYFDLALGPACGVEVPCAPAEHLVLAKCVFRDGLFAALGTSGADGPAELRAAVAHSIADAGGAFDAFTRELQDAAPRLCAAVGASSAL